MAQGVRGPLIACFALGAVAAFVAVRCAVADPPAANAHDALDGPALIDAVLQRNHGPRRGTLDRCVLEVGASEDDPAPAIVAVSWPDALRYDDPDGDHWVLRGEGGWRRTPDGAVALAAGELAECRAVRAAIGAALLLPLYAASSAARPTPDRVAFAAEGTDWELELDPASLWPRRLAAAGVEVELVELFETEALRLPRHVALGGIGERWLRVLDTAVPFTADAFDPARADGPAAMTIGSAPGGPTVRDGDLVLRTTEFPAQPEFQRIAEARWLLVADPGEWEGRRRAVERAGGNLARGGQEPAGDPFLLREGGRDWLVVRFRARPDHAGYEPADGETVRAAPEHVAAVVCPRPGAPLDERAAAGGEALAAFVERHDRRPAGAVRRVVNLFFESFATPADRAAAVLRLELPIER